MKSNRDFKVKNPTSDRDDFLRKPAKLEPARKSGKEKAHYTGPDEEDDLEAELEMIGKRESVLDYFDD